MIVTVSSTLTIPLASTDVTFSDSVPVRSELSGSTLPSGRVADPVLAW
jgi:hypothetical protein